MRKRLGLLLISAAACAACVAAYTQPAPAPQGRPADPRYDEKGDLKRPEDYKTWVFVGASVGLRYHKDLPDTKPRVRVAPTQFPAVMIHGCGNAVASSESAD